MSKDPAVLFYINDWLTSTSEMDADCRGWYLNLLLHNYDKKDLPNDLEKLAVLAGVKFSEFIRFEQVFKQVLEQKFELSINGRLTNARTSDILQARENFKEKRSNSGKTSYLMRFFSKHFCNEFKNKDLAEYVKNNFDYSIDLKNEHILKQVFKQMFELYRNENENEIKDKNESEVKEVKFNFKNSLISFGFRENLIDEWLKVRKTKKATNTETAFKKFITQVNLSNADINEILELCVVRSWSGFEYEWLKNEKGSAEKEKEPIVAGRMTATAIKEGLEGWE